MMLENKKKANVKSMKNVYNEDLKIFMKIEGIGGVKTANDRVQCILLIIIP